jgi:hypothetical protein
MTDRVVCPVCGTETRRRRFPDHLANEHPRGSLRTTYGYAAFWAGILPTLALALVLAQAAVLMLGLPLAPGVRDVIASAAGLSPESVPAFLSFVATPALGVLLGFLGVALARGLGQQVKRGWRPRRFEYALVATWLVPFVGPGRYLIGATRRFVAVRFVREKVAAVVVTASKDLADADAALAANDTGAAADAFAAAGRLLQSISDDAHFRNPTVGAHVDALAHACGMATTICEHHADERSTTDQGPPAV